jgi:hypothetical protein
VSVLSCCAETFATLSRAAARAARSRLRDVGWGRAAPDWPRRAQECERCPLRVIRAGTSYCGRPFTEMIARDPSVDGCGCPIRAKAQDPGEHCPLDHANHPAAVINRRCTCKWCTFVIQ